MTKEEAFELVVRVCRAVQLTANDHDKVREALVLLQPKKEEEDSLAEQ